VSPGWTIHFIERASRYWVEARAGHKANELFEQGTSTAWEWGEPGPVYPMVHGWRTTLWQDLVETGQCLSQRGDNPEYRRRKVWREGLEVALENQRSRTAASRGQVEHPSRRLVRPVRFMPITIRPTTVPTEHSPRRQNLYAKRVEG